MQVFDLYRKKIVSLQPKIIRFWIIITSTTNELTQHFCEMNVWLTSTKQFTWNKY